MIGEPVAYWFGRYDEEGLSGALLLDYNLTHASILTSLAHSHFKLYLSAVRSDLHTQRRMQQR